MNWRWRLHVLNRSMELRWKYGAVEEEVEPGVLTDLDLVRLRKALGPDFERLVRQHRDLLPQAGRDEPEATPYVPIWERPPW